MDNVVISDNSQNEIINNVIFTRENVRKIVSQLSHSYTISPDKMPYFIFKKFSYFLSIPIPEI